MMERQALMGDNIEVRMEVHLDPLDKAILEIFYEHPKWHFKAHQIRTILNYKNMHINPSMLTKKLDFLVITTIISKARRSRAYSYFLNDY